MSQPTPYTPNADFSQQEANNASGRSTVNTAALDAEFAAIENTLDQTLNNIQLIQRDDGRLGDLVVEYHTLSPDVLNLIGGYALRGLWTTETTYSDNDIVSNGEYTYVCTVAHTSGVSFDDTKFIQFGFTNGTDAATAAANAQLSANNAAASALSAAASSAAALASENSADVSESAALASQIAAAASASSSASSATSSANSAAEAAVSAAAISLPLSISNGGTGNTSSGAALTALGGIASTTLASSSGSNSVGFIQSGSGAAPRTIQDKMRESVSVTSFYANGVSGAKVDKTGVIDSTLGIQAAIDSVAFGGSVLMPEGIYKTTGLDVKEGVTLRGEGAYGTVIRTTHATKTIVTLNTSSTITDIKLISSIARTSGYHIDCVGNSTIIDNCELGNYYIGVNVGIIGNPVIVSTLIKDTEFRNPSVIAGSGAVQFINYSNAAMRNCIITGDAGPQPAFGVRYQNGDTAFLSDTNITAHGRALYIDTPVAANVYALNITSCLFDSSSGDSASIIPAGNLYNTKIVNSWFGLAVGNGCYVAPQGAGKVDGLTFTGCEFTDNGDCGLIAVGTGVKNWIVTGGHSGGNANSGIRAASGTTYFTITGHRAGNIANRGANNVGITIDAAASDYYIIEGCNVTGNTTNAIVDGGTGSNATVVNNLGYNGVAAVAGATVGASPWSYTAGHSPETMYFAGGTLSEIRVDGAIVQNATAATIQLVPNQVMQVTYTAGPTVMRKRN